MYTVGAGLARTLYIQCAYNTYNTFGRGMCKCTIVLAGESPNVRSYTVYLGWYDSGQPYVHLPKHVRFWPPYSFAIVFTFYL